MPIVTSIRSVAAGQGLSVGGLTTENVTHQLAEFQDNGHKARNRLVQVQTLIDAGLLGKQYQSNLDLMLAEFDRWLAHYQAVFAAPHESSHLLASHFQASQQQFTTIRKQLNVLKDAIALSQQALRLEIQASSQHAQQVLSLGTLIAILLALVLTWSVTRLTLRPLNQMQQALEDIAQGEGDLTRRLTITRATRLVPSAPHLTASSIRYTGSSAMSARPPALCSRHHGSCTP